MGFLPRFDISKILHFRFPSSFKLSASSYFIAFKCSFHPFSISSGF